MLQVQYDNMKAEETNTVCLFDLNQIPQSFLTGAIDPKKANNVKANYFLTATRLAAGFSTATSVPVTLCIA